MPAKRAWFPADRTDVWRNMRERDSRVEKSDTHEDDSVHERSSHTRAGESEDDRKRGRCRASIR